MKISQKLFLLLVSIVIALVLVCSLLILDILKKQTKDEKISMSDISIRQMLLSYECITNEIERYAYERCRSEGIVSDLSQEKNARSVERSINYKLDAIIRNNRYLLNGAVVAGNGHVFCSSLPDSREQLDRFLSDRDFSSNKDILWVRDSSGNLFFCRNLYQIYPYKVVGCSVFLIDQEYLCSMIGMDHLSIGVSCIIDEYGNIVILSENTQESQTLFAELLAIIRNGQVLARTMLFQGENYHVIAANRQTDIWSMIYAVTEKSLLASFYHLQNMVWMVALVLIVICGMFSFWIAYVFTSRLRMLKKHVNQLDCYNTSQRIPSMGNDEIGALANDFNHLLQRLDQIYIRMLKKSEDEQKTKYELLEFRYRALQSQVSPHFLCNILSSISLLSFAGETQQVEKLAIDASRYLRSNLGNSNHKFNTLAEEIRLVQEYVHLYQSISAVNILLDVHYDSHAKEYIVPNMLLQPLVENSLKHGISPEITGDFKINIAIKVLDINMLQLSIYDNGIGYTDEVIEELQLLRKDPTHRPIHIGFGTAGIIRRLELQYRKFTFDIGNREEGGAFTTITIPASPSDASV